MIPWAKSEANLLIEIGEEEFNKKLARVGGTDYLGNASTFQLLHVFAFQGAALSLLMLLDMGVDLFSTTQFGVNVLHLAAAGGSEDIVRLSLDRGFDVNLRVEGGKRLTPLMFAARMGHPIVVKLLLERGAEVDATDNDGNSILAHAAARGNESVVRILLDNGARTQCTNNKGCTALHHASHNGHAMVIEKLIKYGAEVNGVDLDGFSSLRNAIYNNHAQAVRALLEKGADPNLRGSDGLTPLAASVYMNSEEVVRLLVIAPGIDLEARVDGRGRTALKLAVDKMFPGVAQILVRGGADIWARDNSGESPVSRSRRSDYPMRNIRKMLDEAISQESGAERYGGQAEAAEPRWWEKLGRRMSRIW